VAWINYYVMGRFHALTLGLLLLVPVISATDGDAIDDTGCPKVFQGKCRCGNFTYDNWKAGEKVFMVNCTNAGFKNTEMLEQLPDNTQVLLFNGNHLSTLDWNVFGVWDEHVKLEVIDLSNNRIEDILGKAFHKVKHVKRLVLDHNNLKITGRSHHPRMLTNFESLEELHLTNAFTEVIDSKWYLDDLKDILLTAGMTNLWKLHLEQNEIWSITDDTFCGLPNLKDLYLGDNQLTDLDFNFKCIKKLRFLDVQRNKIKRLDKRTLDRIDDKFGSGSGDDGPKKLNLNWNPWECDCYLRPFVKWVKNTRARLYEERHLSCYRGYPELNSGKTINKIRDPDSSLLCPGDPNGPTHALLTILILLAMMLLVVALVYLNRERIRKINVGPLIDNFSQRMQYSTIKNNFQAFNDGPNDHLDTSQPPPQTVTYLSNPGAGGSSHRISLSPSALPPEVHV